MEKQLSLIIERVSRNLKNELINRTCVNTPINFIYKRFGRYINRYLDYNFLAKAFNQEFFFKNFLKNLLFFDHLNGLEHIYKSGLVDIGCGAAPASIAFYMLYQQKFGSKNIPKIRLVDKSYRQLELARHFCKKLGVSIQKSNKEVFHVNEKTVDEVAHFSYFICEQERQFIKELYLHRNNLKNGFSVIDYKYVVDRIKNMFEKNGDYGVRVYNLRVQLPPKVRELLNEREIIIYGCYYENKQRPC